MRTANTKELNLVALKLVARFVGSVSVYVFRVVFFFSLLHFPDRRSSLDLCGGMLLKALADIVASDRGNVDVDLGPPADALL